MLFDIPLAQIRSLHFAGNVSQDLRRELESHFLESDYYELYRFHIGGALPPKANVSQP